MTIRKRKLVVAIGLAVAFNAPAQIVDLGALGSRGFVIEGAAAGDKSGNSVSGAGDVNGDGLADLIVGAPLAEPNGVSRAGTSYVIFGKSDAGTTSLNHLGAGGFILTGAAPLDLSGWSVSSAGDVNGDGLADLIVGVPGDNPDGVVNAGASYVVFGKVDASPIELNNLGAGGFVIAGVAVRDGSGGSVSGAGDVNGDGLADLIVGADDADPNGEDSAGTSYVVFGKADLGTVDLDDLGTGGFALEGVAAGDKSGNGVSGAGDVNGDGLADLIVGARHADPNGASGAGTSYVVFGKSDAGTVSLDHLGIGGFVLEGDSAEDASGYSVSGVGDVNGDGLADLIVGAWRADPNGASDAGTSYIVFGKSDADAIELGQLGDGGFVVEGASAGDNSGASVSGAGDVNGDGLADVIVGAYHADPNGEVFAGTSYVVFGKSDANSIDLGQLGVAGFALEGVAAIDRSGRSVSGAGDVNGDGLADVIVGAWGVDVNGAMEAGTSYVVFSAESPTLSATYQGYARDGDAPRVAVGATGDGSNDSTPDSRAWIDFEDGGEFGKPASLHRVTLNRTPEPFGDAAAGVHWQIQSGRNDWTTAELTLKYLSAELFVTDEDSLQVFHAPSASGPYMPLPTIVNPANNTLTVTVDELGFFFIGKGISDRIFADGFES